VVCDVTRLRGVACAYTDDTYLYKSHYQYTTNGRLVMFCDVPSLCEDVYLYKYDFCVCV